MDIIDRFYRAARSSPRRVLFPEHRDPRIREAARQLVEQKVGLPVFVDFDRNEQTQAEVFRRTSDYMHWYGRIIESLPDGNRYKIQDFSHNPLWKNDLLLAAGLLRTGYADVAIAGVSMSSSEVLRAGISVIGMATDAKFVSSAYVIDLTHRILTFADCAVIPDPTSEQLADMAINAAHFHEQLTGEVPRVAFLSFSTKGSASFPSLEKIHAALETLQLQVPEMKVDGELQFDAAFVPEIGQRKAPDSEVAGRANVFIFPDLNSANIACKVAKHIGNAGTVGPFLLGISKPWIDIPRGSSVKEILDTAVVGTQLARGTSGTA